MKFTKMQGNGNDFIIIEDLDNKITDEYNLAKKLCDRNFGIGGDGILLVRKSDKADIKMVIINSDGSYASMCGNGIRCFAKYVWEKNIVSKDKIDIETGDGIKIAKINLEGKKAKSVTINMGKPSFNYKDIPCNLEKEIVEEKIVIGNKEYHINSMLMGVPHTVILGELDTFDVEEGKAIEKLDIFPKGTNVNFCEVISENKIKVKTWERGAGATLACGTGSCASAITCNKLGYTKENVTVEIPGGILEIDITEEGIFMTGPAEVSFYGEY